MFGFPHHGPATWSRPLLSAIVVLALGPITRPRRPLRPTTMRARWATIPLPDPLTSNSGRKVMTLAEWIPVRRPELLRLFEINVYGKVPQPPRPVRSEWVVTSEDRQALGGTAIRREVSFRFTEDPDGPRMDLLLYLPKTADPSKHVPAILGLNFEGNHTVHPDPGIKLSRKWMRNTNQGVVDHKATEASRGVNAARWPVERILARGYALATVYYGDLEPDYDDGFHEAFAHSSTSRARSTSGEMNGCHRRLGLGALPSPQLSRDRSGDQCGEGRRNGSLASGQGRALGGARIRDSQWSFPFNPAVEAPRSRGGSSARPSSESILAFPHWFCSNFQQYNGHEARLPVDQHELIALIAPRPVLICSAEQDLWADPKGEFLAALAADPVYRLLGTDGLAAHNAQPVLDHLIKSTIGYRFRPGKHEVTSEDWDAFMDFADDHFGHRRPPATP